MSRCLAQGALFRMSGTQPDLAARTLPRRQVARKWGDDVKEPAALDFSEKAGGASGDSEPDQAPGGGGGAPPPDLSLRSRIDEDEDAEGSEEEGDCCLPLGDMQELVVPLRWPFSQHKGLGQGQ